MCLGKAREGKGRDRGDLARHRKSGKAGRQIVHAFACNHKVATLRITFAEYDTVKASISLHNKRRSEEKKEVDHTFLPIDLAMLRYVHPSPRIKPPRHGK